MGVNLSPRKQDILKKMGVDIWRTKASASVPTASVGAPQNDAVLDVPAELARLQQQCNQCTACGLHSNRTQTVFGVGDAGADWLFVGEAPGQQEDLQGEPFVGRAGQLLTTMIGALDLQREQVYIANVLKCRPPNNRDPKADEISQCDHFLQRQIELIQPRVMLALGRISAQLLLNDERPLGQLRGRVYNYGTTQTPLIVTYHPAYLLRSPGQKAKAWDDLWMAKQIVEQVDATN